MQAKKAKRDLGPVLLDKVLSKCKQEEGLDETDQPLYIDEETETIKCRWCGLFKGSNSTPTEVPNPPPEDEEYVVENIVKKQFNTRLGQYEFLVKWRGYSAKHNTWELITNIPDAAVNKFEQDRRTPAVIHAPARSGLRNRQTIKQKLHSDFISNT